MSIRESKVELSKQSLHHFHIRLPTFSSDIEALVFVKHLSYALIRLPYSLFPSMQISSPQIMRSLSYLISA
jgi:hypothetical protein